MNKSFRLFLTFSSFADLSMLSKIQTLRVSMSKDTENPPILYYLHFFLDLKIELKIQIHFFQGHITRSAVPAHLPLPRFYDIETS